MTEQTDNRRSNTFEFGATLDQFKDTLARRVALPDSLDKPLRAMVAQLGSLIERGPVSVYMTSEEGDRAVRDHFAFLLATYLRDRESTTLIIDADYMDIGLSGLVPQKDALGFLDLLLYGSSLGVIAQDGPNHLRVIGAGSFPVTKRKPFVMEAFRDAHRYLLNHSRCLIYLGPIVDDEESAHPFAEQLDLIIALGRGRRQRNRPTRMDNTLSGLVGQRVWHVRLVDPSPDADRVSSVGATSEPGPGPDPAPASDTAPLAAAGSREAEATEPATPQPHADDGGVEEKVALGSSLEVGADAGETTDPAPEPPVFDTEPAFSERQRNSMLPKIITFSVGFLVVAFIVWWLYQTKVFRTGGEAEVAQQSPTVQSEQQRARDDDGAAMDQRQSEQDDSPPEQREDVPATVENEPETGVVGSDPAADQTEPAPADQTQRDQPQVEQPAIEQGAGERSASGTPVAASETPPQLESALEPGVTVADNLRDYRGAYLVHVSSFRDPDRARVEGQSLADAGHAVIIALVDTGGKGFYHRVYVGPFKYREAARMAKIKLDEIPFVKFTRITKVPG